MSLAWDKAFFGPGEDLRSGWKLLGFLLFLAVAKEAVFTVLSLWPWLRTHEHLPGALLLFLISLGVTHLFLRMEDRSLASIGLDLGRRWFRDLGWGALAGAALMLLSALSSGLAGGLHLARTPGAGILQALWGAWFFLGVALHEELLFRGYAFQRLVEGLGPRTAQLLMAAFFAYSHWANPGMMGPTKAWATLNIALASLLLGLAWLRTRSLALPVGLHLGWNWAQGSLLGFGVSGNRAQGLWHPIFHNRPEWVTGGAFGLEAGLPCALWCALALLVFAHWGPRPAQDPPLPDASHPAS